MEAGAAGEAECGGAGLAGSDVRTGTDGQGRRLRASPRSTPGACPSGRTTPTRHNRAAYAAAPQQISPNAGFT